MRSSQRPGRNPSAVFGHIPSFPIFSRWADREALLASHVHGELVAGIHGRKNEGAFSVVLNGGYENEDHGETFTYIGCGGRPKGVRSGPQTKDQSLENHYNKSLVVSSQHQHPVRVIRGYKLTSRYKPYEGFRYDGLYTVHNPREVVGDNGFKQCLFDFERIPGQPPLPVVGDVLPGGRDIRPAQTEGNNEAGILAHQMDADNDTVGGQDDAHAGSLSASSVVAEDASENTSSTNAVTAESIETVVDGEESNIGKKL